MYQIAQDYTFILGRYELFMKIAVMTGHKTCPLNKYAYKCHKFPLAFVSWILYNSKKITRLLSCKQYSLYIKIGNIGEMAIAPKIQYSLHQKSNDILHKNQEKFQNSYKSISHS